MSYTEIHTGKIKPILDNINIELFKQWLSNKDNLYVDDFDEIIENQSQFFEVRDKNKKYKEPLYIKYIYNKGTLYEVIEHQSKDADDDINITEKQTDQTINFVYMFYNGGTCFGEMLEKGLNKIGKNEF
jgi:hypothetical protein